MEHLLILLGSIFTASFALLGIIYQVRREKSGGVATSESAEVWTGMKDLLNRYEKERQELKDEMKDLRAKLDECKRQVDERFNQVSLEVKGVEQQVRRNYDDV